MTLIVILSISISYTYLVYTTKAHASDPIIENVSIFNQNICPMIYFRIGICLDYILLIKLKVILN